MRISVDQKHSQTQAQSLSSNVMQAIQMLQLPTLELTHLLQEVVLENPLLEFSRESTQEVSLDSDDCADNVEYENDGSEVVCNCNTDKNQWLQNISNKGETLQENLLIQLGCLRLNKEEREIGEYLIRSIGSNGYLQEDDSPDFTSTPTYQKMLAIIQSFEPAGVGARSVSECLILQLRRNHESSPELETLIAERLNDLADGSLRKIAISMDLPIEKIQEMRIKIAHLNPYPGNGFSVRKSYYVYPEVSVTKIDGKLCVVKNVNSFAELKFNQEYCNQLSQYADANMKRYLSEKKREAAWLLKSIEQRQTTIYRVATTILARQIPFFQRGAEYLQPMTLKSVADQLGMHESTVSRACADKYMQTPQGILPFKFFFSSVNTKGSVVAANGVRKILRELIEAENPSLPYSDSKLAVLLSERGIDLSRRTIAKYRGIMNIPDAASRRR